ncbi:MAG: 4-hydroxybenzoate octaprenyltransferase [Pseudomonadota bacterium]
MTTQASDIDSIVADREFGWMDRYLPDWLRPYGVLARWDRPIGAWLLFWPCLWGLSLADGWPSLWLAVLFLVGAFAMRGAGCTVNDMTDRDLDAKVERTKKRPLASGRLTMNQAIIFLGAQLIVGLVVLLQLNVNAIIVGLASVPLVLIYPWMKRVTWWPQLFLGMTFKWGALVGWTAATGSLGWPAVVLYLAGICWTLGYDTIYAHQDKADDAMIGVKSTARRFGKATPVWLWGFYGLSLLLIAVAGTMVEMRWFFYVGLVPVAGHFVWQIVTLDIDDPENCLLRFRSNRDVGLLVVFAILVGKVV